MDSCVTEARYPGKATSSTRFSGLSNLSIARPSERTPSGGGMTPNPEVELDGLDSHGAISSLYFCSLDGLLEPVGEVRTRLLQPLF